MKRSFEISLWQEFRDPLIGVFIIFVLVLGLHNTFQTLLVVDQAKFNSGDFKNIHFKNSFELAPLALSVTKDAVQINPSLAKIYKNKKIHLLRKKLNANLIPVTAKSKPNSDQDYFVLQGSMELKPIEFYHPKVSELVVGDILSGSLEIEDGNIVGLSVIIQSAKFSNVPNAYQFNEAQVHGNIFEYQLDEKHYTGTINPAGSDTMYMINFMNGPWQGIRIKFEVVSRPEDSNQMNELNESSEADNESANDASSNDAMINAADNPMNVLRTQAPEEVPEVVPDELQAVVPAKQPLESASESLSRVAEENQATQDTINPQYRNQPSNNDDNLEEINLMVEE